MSEVFRMCRFYVLTNTGSMDLCGSHTAYSILLDAPPCAFLSNYWFRDRHPPPSNRCSPRNPKVSEISTLRRFCRPSNLKCPVFQSHAQCPQALTAQKALKAQEDMDIDKAPDVTVAAPSKADASRYFSVGVAVCVLPVCQL